MRIALIHAVRVAIDPVEDAFSRLWPEVTLMNLLDDRLSGDLAEVGMLTPSISNRIGDLADYAFATGVDAFCIPVQRLARRSKRYNADWPARC